MGGDSDRPETGEEEFLRLSRELDAAEPRAGRGWQPPTEAEFNDEWLKPEEILTEIPERLEGLEEQQALTERLRAGFLLAVARDAQIGRRREAFARVPASCWEAASDIEIRQFWSRGQLSVMTGSVGGYGDGITHRYFDIRFDPKSLSSRVEVTAIEAIPPHKLAPPNPAISPEEYRTWTPPAAVLKRLDGYLGRGEAQAEIYNRLVGGELLSVARASTWFTSDGLFEIKDYHRLGAFLWDVNSLPEPDELMWVTGTHTLTRPDWPDTDIRYNVKCFGIRFDPEGVAAILVDCGADGPSETAPVPERSPEARTGDLPGDDAKRFSRAILAGWPDSTREFARKKALLFFPDKRVPRDWFYEIFSSIRGHRNPGKQPQKRE